MCDQGHGVDTIFHIRQLLTLAENYLGNRSDALVTATCTVYLNIVRHQRAFYLFDEVIIISLLSYS